MVFPHWPLFPTSNSMLPPWARNCPRIWLVWEYAASLLWPSSFVIFAGSAYLHIPLCGSPHLLCLPQVCALACVSSEKGWAKTLSVGCPFGEMLPGAQGWRLESLQLRRWEGHTRGCSCQSHSCRPLGLSTPSAQNCLSKRQKGGTSMQCLRIALWVVKFLADPGWAPRCCVQEAWRHSTTEARCSHLSLCKAGYHGNSRMGCGPGRSEARRKDQSSLTLYQSSDVCVTSLCQKDVRVLPNTISTKDFGWEVSGMYHGLSSNSWSPGLDPDSASTSHTTPSVSLTSVSTSVGQLAWWDGLDLPLQGFWALPGCGCTIGPFIVITGYRKPWETPQGLSWVPDTLLPASHCRAAAQLLLVTWASHPCRHPFLARSSTGMRSFKGTEGSHGF